MDPCRFFIFAAWLVLHNHANGFEFITRLHKGVGLGVVWVLLEDSLALAMVVLSLSGFFVAVKDRPIRVAAPILVLLLVLGMIGYFVEPSLATQ